MSESLRLRVVYGGDGWVMACVPSPGGHQPGAQSEEPRDAVIEAVRDLLALRLGAGSEEPAAGGL